MLTAEFVSAMRRQARLNPEVSDADILAAGDVEIRSTFLPMLREAGAEYGLRRLLVTIANGRARIPDRAQVAGVRLVQYVLGSSYVVLEQVQPEADVGATYTGGQPYGWYFDAGDICVLPASSSGSLLVRYYQRPGAMILSSTTASTSQLTAVTVGTTSTALTFNVATVVANGDVISAAADHRVVVPGVVSGTGSASFTNALYSTADYDVPLEAGNPARTITLGDWVAPNGYTPFVPLPEELSSALIYKTAVSFLTSLGYLEEADGAARLGDEATARAMRLLTPRADGNPQAWTAGISRTLGQRRGVWPGGRW